jgi:hypothetical protein
VALARRLLVPGGLIPFLVDPQRHHDDYYCFDAATPGPEHGVVVFAVHAVVEAWTDLEAWLGWVLSQPG